MDTDLTIVSAFLDIGRDKWPTFKRTFQDYLRCFLPHIKLNCRIILFCDVKYIEETVAELRKTEGATVKVIGIDQVWCKEHLHAWSPSVFEREAEIMKSEAHLARVEHRLHCPETHIPEYTLIQHAKIDFVCHAIDLGFIETKFVAWSDFGYFQSLDSLPKQPLNLSKLSPDHVFQQCLRAPVDTDYDIIHTMKEAPEVIAGSFFCSSITIMKEYQSVYHKVLQQFQDGGYADDDQHLVIRCIIVRPDLFEFYLNTRWHSAYLGMQTEAPVINENEVPVISEIDYGEVPVITDLCTIMNNFGSDKGNGWHNYTRFYHKLMNPLRNSAINVLEIGIGSVGQGPSSMRTKEGYLPGASLRGWAMYFPKARVYGCDIDRQTLFATDQISTFWIDQTDPKSMLTALFVDLAKVSFHVIVDDGLHNFHINFNCLKLLYAKLAPGGIYIIENVIDYDSKIVENDRMVKMFKENGDQFGYYPIANERNKTDNNLFVLIKKPL